MNSMPALSVIILAAGKGTRMKSDVPKVLHSIAGRPMIHWLLDEVDSLDPAQVIVVVGKNMPDVEEAVSGCEVVLQEEQRGTADAVKAALPLIKDKMSRVLILLGDEPFVTSETLTEMVFYPDPTIMAFEADDPRGFGRLVVDDEGILTNIVEEKDASAEEKKIILCNGGNYCLPCYQLETWLSKISDHNAQGEFYLTDIVEIASKEDVHFDIVKTDAPAGWGINDRIQLAAHEAYIQYVLRLQAMEQGVTLLDPDSVYFSWDTDIGPDVTIEPNVYFGKGVRIEAGAHIKAFSHFEQCHIGKDGIIGPFARLRPGAQLSENVKIGNFVEVKNSKLGAGVKANHLGYIGDADIGAGTNFGCGAITVNYDGYQKHKTIIGDNTMIGSNVNLIAPVHIGEDAFIAAGSTITGDVPAEALGMSRSTMEVRENWIKKYRELKKKK